MSGRARRRFGVVVVLGLLTSLFAGMSAAYAAPDQKTFLFEVNPAVAVDDTDTDFTVEFTNTSTKAQLGGVEVRLPAGFTALSVTSGTTSPVVRSWTSTIANATTVRLTAVTSNDRLRPGESLSAVITAHTKDINTEANDVDEVVTFTALGRQANNFNDQMGANDVFQQTVARDIGALVYRDGEGLVPVTLRSNEILLVSGEQADCTGVPTCTASDSQNFTTVTITAAGCDDGATLVADATEPFAEVQSGEAVGEAAFFHYLYDPVSADCPFGSTVDVTIVHGKDLKLQANDLFVANFYGVDISQYDANYVGDGVQLPDCDSLIPDGNGAVYTTNCLVDIANGSDGITIMLRAVLTPTDPGSITFR